MSLRILVCDDSSFARKALIRSIPAEWEAEALEAKDGAEALALIRRERPGITFMDLNMPEVTGFEVLAALQKDGVSLPVIVCSANIQPSAKARALELGARAFVPKPVQAKELGKILGYLKSKGGL